MTTSMLTVLNSEDLAGKLGKKGTTSDITLYNHKKGGKAMSAVSPTKYPDKLSPILFALYLGDEVLMVVDRLDSTIGEMLVACDVMGMTRGTIFLEEYMQADQVAPLLKGTAMEAWEIRDGVGDPNILREELMAREASPREGATKVTIDHSFHVKGVGVVSLGLVDRGAVKRHQELMALPVRKRTVVRSIQVHDDDAALAGSGSRVGLALKNIEVEDVDRGTVLCEEGSLEVYDELRLRLRVNRFWKDELADGMVVHAVAGMQYFPCRVSMDASLKGGEEGDVTLGLDGRLVLADDDRPVLVWLESTGPRIIGSGELLKTSG